MATPETSVDLTAEELGAWRGLLRVHTALVKALDAELAAAHDLPLSSYEVLITLESAPGRKRRMAELADSVLLSRSGMTRLVDRLAKEELLERDSCTDDGRGCYRGADAEGRRRARYRPADAPRRRARAVPAALLAGGTVDVRRDVEPRASRRGRQLGVAVADAGRARAHPRHRVRPLLRARDAGRRRRRIIAEAGIGEDDAATAISRPRTS